MNYHFTREDLHRKAYLFGLALLICCIPLSKYMMSVAQLFLALNWVLEGKFREKYASVVHNPVSLLLPAISLVYVVSLLWTDNLSTGLSRSNNTLTLLFLPVLMATSPSITGHNIKRLLLLFALAVVASAIVSVVHYFKSNIESSGDFRDISVFMLHTRLSLLVVMAIFVFLYHGLFSDRKNLLESILCLSGAAFLILFLLFLRSFTGVIIFVIVALVSGFILSLKSRNTIFKYFVVVLCASIVLGGVITVFYIWFDNFHAQNAAFSNHDEYTVNGNPYVHDSTSRILENGFPVDVYFCEPEIRKEWNKISSKPYDGRDRKGQEIKMTLRRYLTSKGLRKDSLGISKLEPADIRKIESGLANHRFHENPGLFQRLYETLWEIHIWKNTGYVRMHSMGQRLAFLSVASSVIRENLWTGTGVGDVYDTMKQTAQVNNLEVDSNWEGKPHNQFLFFIVAFGITGFVIVMFCLVYPVVVTKTYNNLLFVVFAGIMVLSMLVLDTLESYFSMTFFAFFYSLFVYGAQKKQHHQNAVFCNT